MYIKRIILKNIRGFEELDFDLTRADGSYAGWTVFTGDNGSGKSALLKAIAVGLVGKETARALQPSFQGWIRNGVDFASIQLFIQKDNLPVYRDYECPNEELLIIEIDLKKDIRKETCLTENVDAKSSHDKCYSWFSCGYGPFRRISGESANAIRQMVDSDPGKFVTLFQEGASLAEVDRWLINLNHKKLEEKPEESKKHDLLLDILRDDLLPNQITVNRVDSDGLWLRDKNGVELNWSDMSDGYRSALALFADIFRHITNSAIFLPHYDKNQDGTVYMEQKGVVLIDEIDAHLHPEWQQKIGFWLKRHFPNIQFLVTTHSPIICQAADDNGLFVLPEPGSHDKPKALSKEEYNKVIASRPDTILLTSAFGLQNTRSPRAVEGRAKFAKLKAKRRAGAQLTSGEEAQLSQLKVFGENEEEL